jgi:heme/copper-type cytochrome/quinol oxidase subunit 2
MIILMFIAVPSISLLYALEEFSGTAALVIQVVGRQWYWVYEYPSFAAAVLELEPLETEAELRDPQDQRYPHPGLRLLDSTPLLLPLALELEFLTASEDVIHGFALPSAGLKMDAVPGRLNQALSTFLRPGIFYGQCSELCGSGHGFMPITAQVVVEALFQLGLLERAELMAHYLELWQPLYLWLMEEEENMLLLDCQQIRSDFRALVHFAQDHPAYLSQPVSPEVQRLGAQHLAPLLRSCPEGAFAYLSIGSEAYNLALEEYGRRFARPAVDLLEWAMADATSRNPNFRLTSAGQAPLSREEIQELLQQHLQKHRLQNQPQHPSLENQGHDRH